MRRKILILLASASVISPAIALAQAPAEPRPSSAVSPPVPSGERDPDLEAQFRNPPESARPRVWWHWMNGNITKDGIAKDLAWMKRVGIGGAQTFDIDQQTPIIVDKRLIYMTPEWKDAFRFAASEADRLGLELAIASSPGWSETGGPWVPGADGMKKLVWSETDIVGGHPFKGRLEAPPAVNGPFQSIAAGGGISALLGSETPKNLPTFYADVAVFAVPLAQQSISAVPVVSDANKTNLSAKVLSDEDLTTGIELAQTSGETPWLRLDYPRPVTVRSVRLHIPEGAGLLTGARFSPRLEVSTNGDATWGKVADVPLGGVPTTISFAPVTARSFRLVLGPPPKGGAGISFAPPVPGFDMSGMGSLGVLMGGKPKPPVIADFRLFADARIDRAELKAGFAIAGNYYDLTSSDLLAKGASPDLVIDLTSRLRSDGTLDWTPPPGNWRILRLGYSLLGETNHPAPAEATGLEVDKFDANAVRRYLDRYLESYRDAAGADLIGHKGVRALVTDSIQVGAANWTPGVIAQFKRLRGYDPTPWLPALTGTLIGTRVQSDGFLFDFRRTLGDMLASEHYGTVAEVAHENGLKVYVEAFENGRPALGDDISVRQYADVPMAALWTYPRAQGPNSAYVADMKGAASVAHIYGQNLAAAESMTAMMAPWAFGPADLKRVIDLEFVTGINRPVVHTSVHVPVDNKKPGLSLGMFGQYFNRQDTWAELARPWVDYISRNSLMLQQGRNVADVAYFYGEDAPLTGLFMTKTIADAPKRFAYDFVSADAVTRALGNDGSELVTPGGARYRALYLGGTSRMMTLATLRRLAALVEGGATVIGLKPEADPGLGGDVTEFAALTAKLWPGTGSARIGRGLVIATKEIEAGLAEADVAPDFHFAAEKADADIPFVHRKLAAKEGGGDSYFLVNRKDRAEKIEARFRVVGRVPELWHAETGTSEPIGYRTEGGETVMALTLQPDEAVHVVFAKAALSSGLVLGAPEIGAQGSISEPWRVQFQAGRGAPAETTMSTLKPLDESTDARIKYFSGIATYTSTFAVPGRWKRGERLWLDLGEAREVAEVTVNGKTVGYSWHAPYRIDVTDAAKAGRNTLQVRVANLWVNRLVGDAQPQAEKITWTAQPTYVANAPLRRSGLIGPVTWSIVRPPQALQ